MTALIDEERRVQFQSEGSHFESEYFLALTYLPPVAASERLRGFMISGSEKSSELKCRGRCAEVFRREDQAIRRRVLIPISSQAAASRANCTAGWL